MQHLPWKENSDRTIKARLEGKSFTKANRKKGVAARPEAAENVAGRPSFLWLFSGVASLPEESGSDARRLLLLETPPLLLLPRWSLRALIFLRGPSDLYRLCSGNALSINLSSSFFILKDGESVKDIKNFVLLLLISKKF